MGSKYKKSANDRWNSIWDWASIRCISKQYRNPATVEHNCRPKPLVIDKDRTPVPGDSEEGGEKTPEPTNLLVLGDISKASLFQRRQKFNRKTPTITMV
jgi:hypothetical protein